MESGSYLTAVKDQYDSLPYPPRDPEDEKQRLITTCCDNLHKISTYCFAGQQRFDDNFSVLVAGGGTGDASIYLGEQLRGSNANIIHLDLSASSLAIAKQRASIRQLDNITFLQESLLNLPQLGLGPFDYINCSGVLHHLTSPQAGLDALQQVLKPHGAIALMLYGRFGRTGIYHMQEMFAHLLEDVTDHHNKLNLARTTLNHLPQSNWFQRDKQIWQEEITSDSGLFDLLLHSTDHPFSVPELYQLIAPFDFQLIDFIGQGLESPVGYQPENYFPQPELLQKITALPREKQQAICEIACGTQRKHTFYLSKAPQPKATTDDLSLVPFIPKPSLQSFCHEAITLLQSGQAITLQDKFYQLQLQPDPILIGIMKHLDNQHSLESIFQLINKEQPEIKKPQFLSHFRQFYQQMLPFDWMYLVCPESLSVGVKS